MEEQRTLVARILPSSHFVELMAYRKIVYRIHNYMNDVLGMGFNFTDARTIEHESPCTAGGFIIVMDQRLPRYLMTRWGMKLLFTNSGSNVPRELADIIKDFLRKSFGCENILTGYIGEGQWRNLGPLYQVRLVEGFQVQFEGLYPEPSEGVVSRNTQNWTEARELYEALAVMPKVLRTGDWY